MINRSQINQSIAQAIAFFKLHHINLPPFAYWQPTDFRRHHKSISHLISAKLGWDVTDFGQSDFAKFGRTIFTVRNGITNDISTPHPYAQKIMYLRQAQQSPIHFHFQKIEDIINLAGGIIVVKLWQKTNSNQLSTKSFQVLKDGQTFTAKPGQSFFLNPGESLHIPNTTYHQFWAKAGSGPVVSMELSSVNDDTSDNYWLNSGARYPEITEDEPAQYILCTEYQQAIAQIESKINTN